MKRKIGIICAGRRETAPLLAVMKEQKLSEKARLHIYEGKINDVDVVLTTCGVCKVNAAMATQILIDSYGCTAIINGGTAGGMDRGLHIYDTVVTAETYYWDVEVPVIGEDIRKVKRTLFRADTELLAAAKKAAEKAVDAGASVAGSDTGAPKIVFGMTVTGEKFIDRDMREEINEEYHPLAVDMETTAIAHVCRLNDIPFIAARSITDTEADSGLDTYEVNCDKASNLSAEFICEMLKVL